MENSNLLKNLVVVPLEKFIKVSNNHILFKVLTSLYRNKHKNWRRSCHQIGKSSFHTLLIPSYSLLIYHFLFRNLQKRNSHNSCMKLNSTKFWTVEVKLLLKLFSWNPRCLMVWSRGRLQLHGNGLTWTQLRRLIHFL